MATTVAERVAKHRAKQVMISDFQLEDMLRLFVQAARKRGMDISRIVGEPAAPAQHQNGKAA